MHTPASIGYNVAEQEQINQLPANQKINKQHTTDKLKDKNLTEVKEYIATEKRHYLTVLAYVDAIKRITSLAKVDKFPFSISIIEHYLLHNHHQALIVLYDITTEINIVVALTITCVKDTEANSNTPPPAPTPSPTPSAPTIPASESLEERERENKKGISITTMLTGGNLPLGFTSYLRKKN